MSPRTVIAGGHTVVEAGVLVTADERALATDAAAATRELAAGG